MTEENGGPPGPRAGGVAEAAAAALAAAAGYVAASGRYLAARREGRAAMSAAKAAEGGGPANPAEPSVRCARGIPDRVGKIFAGAVRSMESGGLTVEGAQRALDDVASGYWPDGGVRPRVLFVAHSHFRNGGGHGPGRATRWAARSAAPVATVQVVVEAGK